MVNINETKQNLFTWKENATRYCSEGKYEEAALQLRFIEEAVVNALYEKNVKGKAEKSFSKIQELKEGGYINKKAESSLHSLRMLGNAAAHAENKDLFKQMGKNEKSYLGDADTLINTFCDTFFTKDKEVVKTFKDFIGNYYSGKFACKFKNDLKEIYEITGHYTVSLWFPEFITKFHPIICEIDVSEENHLGKITEATIRYDNLVLLNYRDGVSYGLWSEISPCKKALCQLYIDADPLKDMPFDYYVKKYSTKEDTMLLMRVIDILTYRQPFFFEIAGKGEPVYISPNGAVSSLNDEQKKIYSLKKMEEEVMILVRKLRNESFNTYRGDECIRQCHILLNSPFCNKTKYFEVAGEGEIPVCMTEMLSGKIFGIGYKYVDDNEQYFLLIGEDLNVFGKYPIDVSGPKIVKNYGDYNPRAISFDAAKLARDILYNDLGAFEESVANIVWALTRMEKGHEKYIINNEENQPDNSVVVVESPVRTKESSTKRKLTKYEKELKRTDTIYVIGVILRTVFNVVFWGIILLMVLL